MAIDPNLMPYQPLEGKTVVLGVTGGIAAYKAADLASNLVQLGADVHVLMTRSATAFVGATTFAALTQNPVHDSVIENWESGYTGHISLGQSAHALVIAPATANTIAKLALGLADDMIGTTALTTLAPIVIAPAMEHEMFHHAATQGHIETLRKRGAIFVGPDQGRLASGDYGEGRLKYYRRGTTGHRRQRTTRRQDHRRYGRWDIRIVGSGPLHRQSLKWSHGIRSRTICDRRRWSMRPDHWAKLVADSVWRLRPQGRERGTDEYRRS
jgi:3-polyprenyl-4-hydroxybenzoate decarboxylase